MYEYEIKHDATGERTIVFGNSFLGACRAFNLTPSDYSIIMVSGNADIMDERGGHIW